MGESKINKKSSCIKSKILTTSIISSRKAQMKLSFGMIFSIILIIIFISFSFYAIQKFLELQDTIKIAQFGERLQSDVNKMWKGTQGSQNVEYNLPRKVNAVCFSNEKSENLVFDSDKFIEGKKIEHITINLEGENKEICIINDKGKIKLVLEKDYGEALVTISEP